MAQVYAAKYLAKAALSAPKHSLRFMDHSFRRSGIMVVQTGSRDDLCTRIRLMIPSRIDETFSEAYNYLGQVLVSQHRWEEAIKAYRQALSNPLYATPDKARFNLGMALVHEGKLQLAMEMFEDALTVNPANVPPALPYLELGKVCVKLGYNTRAREALNKVASMEKGGELAIAASELLAQLK